MPYADREFKSEKGFYEHTIGRYIIKNIFKNDEIIINTMGKPVFKNSEVYFSISHSKEYVFVCFDKIPCGIDIEYIKHRNLKKLSFHFDKNFENLDEFYKFWTYKEASYKLGTNPAFYHYKKFKKDYFLTIVSSQNIEILPTIKEFDI